MDNSAEARQEVRLEALFPLGALRLAAAIIVMAAHSGAVFALNAINAPPVAWNALHNAYSGLTFFFLVSGFTLQLLYGGRISPRRHVRAFLAARLARVYPVYLLSIVAMAPLMPTWGWEAVPQLFMLQSWPPTVAQFTNWNMVAWTLSLELFFYLTFPAVSVMAHRLSLRHVHLAIALVVVAIVTLRTPTAGALFEHPAWLDHVPLPLVRFPEFLLGILIAERYRKTDGAPIGVPPGVAMALFWLVLCLAGPATVGGGLAVASGLIIYTLATTPKAMSARLYSQRRLLLLSAASYSIYLLHQPIHLALVTLGGGGRLLLALQYPLVIATAYAVFFLYEEPTRRWMKRLLSERADGNVGGGTHARTGALISRS